MKTVSIVIPAYNAQTFIENCIGSVLSQSYKAIEVVVVNDGSTDKTPDVLEKLQKKDNRIKVISQKNAGVSAARNTGLTAATGDFVTFVDADDDLPQNAVETMVSLMTDDVDFVICSHNEIRLTSKPHLETPARYEAAELSENFIQFDSVIWWPWGKMFRRSVITENKLGYDKSISFGEDHIFNLLYAKHIKGAVVVSDKPVYNYYFLRGGLCSKYYDNMNELQLYIYYRIADFFGGNDLIPDKYKIFYVGNYFKGCVEYYIAWCSRADAIKNVQKTAALYAPVLDDNALNEVFTPAQIAFFKDGQLDRFISDYTKNNPRATVVRKFSRKVRIILEKLQKLIKS